MSNKDSISIDKKKIINFFKDPKVSWGIVLILLFILLSSSYTIRTSNLPLLKDSTSGEYIPLALDPFYFMRIGETYIENGNSLPEYDSMRYNPVRNTEWHHEIHPFMVAKAYQVLSSSNPNLTFEYVYVLSPAVFFVIGMIIFFLLCYFLTKNKWIALLASAFLSYVPAYLYRTMSGFADHESVGMMTYFLVFLVVVISLKNLGRKKDSILKSAIFGLLTGLATIFNIATWTGISNSLLIILPLSFFFVWIFNTKKENKPFEDQFLTYYITWIISTVLLSTFFNIPYKMVLNMLQTSEGIISLAVLGIIIIDYILKRGNYSFIKHKKYRLLYSVGISVIVGFIGLIILRRNPLDLVSRMFTRLLAPFGTGRIGSTVAENQAPYLSQWIGQTGLVLFWFFLLGLIMFGYHITNKIKSVKERIVIFSLYILMCIGIIFSKYSQSSILNGESFVSILFYFVPALVFGIYLLYAYFKVDFKWSKVDCFIFGWMIFTIISGRAAARMFFAITPFVCFIGAYFVIYLLIEYSKSKDKTFRVVMVIGFLISAYLSSQVLYGSYQAVSTQAQGIGPSAHIQWQQAMSWVRDNTPEESVFVHWWDYGYWVETLGQRRVVSDGGHFQGSEDGNHKIGRYVLTTPNPETAYSYFKSMNISYLLIDPTDFGKYSAYSRIGSDDNWDRFSIIPSGTYNPRYTQETNNETIYIYEVQTGVDEDIYYTNSEGKQIFLPGPVYGNDGQPIFKSYLAGITFKRNAQSLSQPEAIYFYNNIQQNIPLRYVYYNGELFDFNSGVEGVAYIVPSFTGTQIDPIGGSIYLSPKVSKSLFAQLYLMDNAFGYYDDVTLAHSQDSPIVASIKSQNPNAPVSDFLLYSGLQGPIKIWETGYPEDTKEVPEFYERFNGRESGFGSLDSIFE